MTQLYRRWETPCLFGDLAVLAFLAVQGLDGIFTYLGVIRWGPAIEANPLISSAVEVAGPGTGVVVIKLVATAFGMLLHLRGVHNLVAVLTVIYLAIAILPWTALFLTN